MKLIFLDTETSGLDPEKHRALEIAFRIMESPSGKLISSYHSTIFQPAEIWAEADPKSLKINGFSWEELLRGKPEKVVAAEITEILNGAGIQQKNSVFVCQNPAFDKIFFLQLISSSLQNEYEWPYHWLDLASMFWAYRLGKENAYITEGGFLSKDKIADYFGLPPEIHPHRALNGVNHLIACYEAMFPPLRQWQR